MSILIVLLLAQLLPGAEPPCRVTKPNGVVPGETRVVQDAFGNALLSVGPFGLWPEGTVVLKPGGAGFVTSDGGLGMKFGWTKAVAGRLHVSGQRLDGDAGPLRWSTHANPGAGFQASHIVFASAGCWEVTAQIDDREDSKLTFVTRVVKIGEGPSRYDPPYSPTGGEKVR
jgi:hypothetical protein